MTNYKPKTIAIHSHYDRTEEGSQTVPLYFTTSYHFKNTQHAADLFELKEIGNIYTRLMNPTTDVFEKRFAALEGGTAAVGTASGMAAIFYAIANVAEAGDNIIVAKQVYGGTSTLTTHTIKRFGIEARTFDVNNPDEINDLVDEKTKLILFETLTNPSIDVADIEKITKIAKKYNILTCADNTVLSSVYCNPIKFGVDIVVHSTSKYTTGQGLALGGIVVEREKLSDILVGNERYKHFYTPDESYHGLVYTNVGLPPFSLRIRLALLRDLGATPSPFNSWIYIAGLETISIRLKQHAESTLKIAEFLEKHPKVKKVNYPGLKSNKYYELGKKYFPEGQSGLLSFEVESREIASNIANNTKLFTLVANIGDSKSVVTHPASTTHQQLSEKELIDAGVSPSLLRLSIGLEDCDDLIADLEYALNK